MSFVRRMLKIIWSACAALSLLTSFFLFYLFYERYLIIDFDENGRGTDGLGFPVHDTTLLYGVLAVLFALPALGTLVAVGLRRWRRGYV